MTKYLISEIRYRISRMDFIVARFGNVIGSAGSVVPIFHRQIKAGAPVTVVGEKMREYFIRISDAVLLILQVLYLGSIWKC